MNATVSEVYLRDQSSGSPRQAELLDVIGSQQLDDWHTKWAPAMRQAIDRLEDTGVPREDWPQDAHWNWERKVSGPRLLAREGFSVVCDGVTQGMMIVDTSTRRCRIDAQKNLHLVYLEFLQVAPWNRRRLSGQARYGGIGSILVRAAIAFSESLEFAGRIGLHSLPQAESFYTATCGMADLGLDDAFKNLRYFEMTPEQARAFVEGKRTRHS